MKFALITQPEWMDDEAAIVTALFDAGLQLLHLRKPSARECDMADFLDAVPEAYHERIALHDFHHLASAYAVGGLHLNSRNPHRLPWFEGRYSRSCHSIDEAAAAKSSFDYVFLSPVFDSISKSGYRSRYSMADLANAHHAALIDERVFALGGVDLSLIGTVASFGFGGVAMLGGFWRHYNESGLDALLSCLARVLDECSSL